MNINAAESAHYGRINLTEEEGEAIIAKLRLGTTMRAITAAMGRANGEVIC